MAQQTIIWTPLPVRGPSTGPITVSVLLSVRLVSDSNPGTLAAFPDFRSWPTVPISWAVLFNGTSVPATESSASALDPTLWSHTFPTTTTVIPHGFDDFSASRLRSYPVGNVHDFVKQQYQQIAITSPTAPVPLSTLFPRNTGNARPNATAAGIDLGQLGAATDEGANRTAAITNLDNLYRTQLTIPAKNVVDTGTDFLRADQFFDRRSVEPPASANPNNNKASAVPPVPTMTLDFHQLVSALGDHPDVLRRLGLLRDLVVTPPAGLTGPVTVRVVPTLSHAAGPTPQDTSPISNAFVANGILGPAARAGGLHSGVLPLNADDFRATVPDVDGAAAKLVSFVTVAKRVNASFRLVRPPLGKAPDPVTPPNPPGYVAPPR
jgi:hypothetical protein